MNEGAVVGDGEIEVDGATTVSNILDINNLFDANGSFDASSATITMGSNANLTLASTVSFGTLDDAEGTVTYDGGTGFESDSYYNLIINSGNTHSASTTTTVNGILLFHQVLTEQCHTIRQLSEILI